jgi:hypothetical protein
MRTPTSSRRSTGILPVSLPAGQAGRRAVPALPWKPPAPRQSRPPAPGVAAKSNFLSVTCSRNDVPQ